jgi:L-asparaginase
VQVVSVKKIQKVVVLGTGGTIAGTAANASEQVAYIAAQLGVAQLTAALPGLDAALAGRQLLVEQVAQLDSKDMDHATWQLLARRCTHWLAHADVDALVITHGTDTIEETAWFLQVVLQPSKPVVMVCAMRPASSDEADGPQNLHDALVVSAQPLAAGVSVVCAGVIHSARHVQKVHPYRLDAFSSGDAGPLGWIQADQVRWSSAHQEASASTGILAEQILRTNVSQWPVVEVALSHAGASRRAVDALVQGGVAGLVVAASGNGTVHHEVQAALRDAQRRGVQVRRSTRCQEGPMVGNSSPWSDMDGLSPLKARISLMLELLAASEV